MTIEQLMEIANKFNEWLNDISNEYGVYKIDLQDIIKQFLN